VSQLQTENRGDLNRILRELGSDQIVDLLSERLSGADLNTLLLEVFRKKAQHSSPSDLLRRYRDNRFVQPAIVDVIALKQLELDLLRIAQGHQYSPVQLSPVAPMGSCSIVATSDQNKIISALRGTEVVADATNLLALQICDSIKTGKMNHGRDLIRFSTTHRHVRAQKWSWNAFAF
jgi:hypothetical protein